MARGCRGNAEALAPRDEPGRQGGRVFPLGDFSRRVRQGRIVGHVSLQPVFVRTSGGTEEIDLVIVVDAMALLVQCKCILWPDDSAQFANYRMTIEQGVEQIARKVSVAKANLAAFAQALVRAGFGTPELKGVLGCIVTNSAVYAGFSFGGISTLELGMLSTFLAGSRIRQPLAGPHHDVLDVSTYSVEIDFQERDHRHRNRQEEVLATCNSDPISYRRAFTIVVVFVASYPKTRF
jgi:hypothetical protein